MANNPCSHCGRLTHLEQKKGRRWIALCFVCRMPAYKMFTGDEIREAKQRLDIEHDQQLFDKAGTARYGG
jgi:hypothetical protein